jgi:uncharacterized protein YkwD
LRKLGALALAVPVVAGIYLASLARAGVVGRIGSGIAAFAIVGLVVVASLPPAASNAAPVSGPPERVDARFLDTVQTGHGLASPFVVQFDAPMDAASVAAVLRLDPDGPIALTWDASGSRLTIAPVEHWTPDTLYRITIGATARAAAGGSLEAPLRTLVLTEAAAEASLEPTARAGKAVLLDTAFRIATTREVTADAVRRALRTDPAVAGQVVAGDAPGELLFRPAAPLAPGTTYRVWLEGLRDADGVAFAALPSIKVRTVAAPSVVRFRPRNGTEAVARTDAISVRFTEAMNRKVTAAAFRVTASGKALAGRTSWAEAGTVLVFVPAEPLPYGATVTASVADTAASRAGVPLAGQASGTFTVEPKPKPKPKPKPAAPATKPITKSGGGGAVSGSWRAVEAYYLRLMNCTRTGGWVTSDGDCSSPGGRNVAPLSMSAGISDKVARPYAKLLATRGICNHFIGGNPGDRLRRAGFTSYRWAENLGCRSGNPYSAVLGSHRFFQDEKPYNGGHYRNMMNPDYDRAGIGVWVSSGRVRLVVDFYHP